MRAILIGEACCPGCTRGRGGHRGEGRAGRSLRSEISRVLLLGEATGNEKTARREVEEATKRGGDIGNWKFVKMYRWRGKIKSRGRTLNFHNERRKFANADTKPSKRLDREGKKGRGRGEKTVHKMSLQPANLSKGVAGSFGGNATESSRGGVSVKA